MNKTQKIVAASVAAVVVIAGGVVAKQKHDEAVKKEKERIAFINRAIVEESCVMNGWGQGNCAFTNVGKTAGSVCGYIEVQGPGTASSQVFCSGQVAPQSTEKVEFNIPTVAELCDNGFENWTKKCDFTFIKK